MMKLTKYIGKFVSIEFGREDFSRYREGILIDIDLQDKLLFIEKVVKKETRIEVINLASIVSFRILI